jgi:hypothetical protein
LKPRQRGEPAAKAAGKAAAGARSRTAPAPGRARQPRACSTQTSHALILTLTWLAAFVIGLLLLEAYIHRRTPQGLRLLLPEDRMDVMRPWIVFYTFYLGGILAFWYTKPFKAPRTSKAEKIRFALALLCTVIFNGTLLWLVAQTHLSPGEPGHDVLADVDTATGIAKYMSFIVAPANLYYFGLKERPQG